MRVRGGSDDGQVVRWTSGECQVDLNLSLTLLDVKLVMFCKRSDKVWRWNSKNSRYSQTRVKLGNTWPCKVTHVWENPIITVSGDKMTIIRLFSPQVHLPWMVKLNCSKYYKHFRFFTLKGIGNRYERINVFRMLVHLERSELSTNVLNLVCWKDIVLGKSKIRSVLIRVEQKNRLCKFLCPICICLL